MSSLELIATAAFGLESVVARELEELGYTGLKIEDGRITFPAEKRDIIRTNLWLRSADRILLKIARFPSQDFGSHFDQVAALPWSEWLPVDARFPVDGKSVSSRLHSVPTLQGVTKKAIVESMRKTYNRFRFDESGVEYPIEVSVVRDVATLSIDTSGDGLHKRGYREVVGPAPLRETTAAAMILLSYWNRERPFLDPFCGSGTLPIEAAMIARRRAPGLHRGFLCEFWPQLLKEEWKDVRDEARDFQITGPLPAPIIGQDIDGRAIRLSEQHAGEAGVLGDIQFRKMDVLEYQTSLEYGVAICNPPYGERLGTNESAEALYDDMADAFQALNTWSIYVFTSHPGFERLFRRRADRRRKIYAGKIPCTFYQFFGPRPPWEGTWSPPIEDGPQPQDSADDDTTS